MRKIVYLFIALYLTAGLFAQQPAASFTMDDIRNWTGTGSNRSALAIQWITGDNPTNPTAEEIHFLVWGYRWEAEDKPTGLDMIRAVAKEDPRFYVMLEDSENATVWGFGYDATDNGTFAIKNDKTSVTISQADFVNGIVSIKANPDGFKPNDAANYWMGGWKEHYCTYYTGSNGNTAPTTQHFSYAQTGADLRLLANGSWDAWTLSAIDVVSEANIPPLSKYMQAAEANDGGSTNNEKPTVNEASAFYSDCMLYLNNMEGYTCSIVSIVGKTVDRFQVKDQKESRPVALQKGIYILAGTKGGSKVSFKFVVR